MYYDLNNKEEALKPWKWNNLSKRIRIASALGGNKLGTFVW